jgi:hypothetical protein
MDEVEPLKLDRDLKRAAWLWRNWRRGLRDGTAFDSDPFELVRSIAGKSALEAVSALPDADPLKQPLRRWIYRLAEQRIDQSVIAIREHSWRSETHTIETPEYGRYSLRELLQRAMSDPERSLAWLRQLFANSQSCSDAALTLWERRAEVARRMHVDATTIERACSESDDVARALLDRSRELAREACAAEFPALFEQALARNSTEGWPSRINLRVLGDWLNEARLLDGFSLDPGPLPHAFGAASFLRALARIGASLVDAAAPARQPFVIAHDPYGLRRRTYGALFAMLPLEPAFARRKLALNGDKLRVHQRALARTVLIELRHVGLLLLLRGAALEGTARARSRYQELTEQVIGAALPASTAGVVLRIRTDADQRFCGMLLAAARAERLISEHDEDWFRNPRAVDELRSELDLSPPVSVTREELELGADLAYRRLLSALA